MKIRCGFVSNSSSSSFSVVVTVKAHEAALFELADRERAIVTTIMSVKQELNGMPVVSGIVWCTAGGTIWEQLCDDYREDHPQWAKELEELDGEGGYLSDELYQIWEKYLELIPEDQKVEMGSSY